MNFDSQRWRSAATLATIAVGCLLSAWLVRGFFVHPRGEIHGSHETHSYVYRHIEFCDALAAGHFTPQWCSHFRGGLGSPFFSYYQPGFFYAASLFSWLLDPVPALGATLWCFALFGFASMYGLVASRFDPISGVVAASLLLLSSYAGAELYVRGDLSEFAAMMVAPALVASLVGWQESGRPWQLGATSLTFALLTSIHPCIALPTLLLALGIIAGYALAMRTWRRSALAATAVFLGGTLAAFYWLPVALEWNLVQADGAFDGFYHYSKHFINPLWLIGPYTRLTIIPFTFGLLLPVLALANVASLTMRWKLLTAAQQRFVVVLVICLLVCVFMMTRFSAPLWSVATPLQKLQFPWRLLTLATIALAALCGPALLMLESRWRLLAAVAIVGVAWWSSISYTQRQPAVTFRPVASAAEMASDYFADLENEWLPRGAASEFPAGPPPAPRATQGVTVSDFSLGTGRLSCSVEADSGGVVTLPHYYFLGWRATLAGNPIPLHADEQGLMSIELPPRAATANSWRSSTQRRPSVGVGALSLASLAAVVALVALVQRWSRKAVAEA